MWWKQFESLDLKNGWIQTISDDSEDMSAIRYQDVDEIRNIYLRNSEEDH